MTYATRQDMEVIWGTDFVLSLLPYDVAEDPAATEAAIAGALQLAAEEVNTHMSARYSIPFKTVPRVLKSPAANIAVYVLANRHSSLTTTIEDRYNHAVKLLQRIAEGKAGLGADEPTVSSDPNTSTGGAYFSANDRQFGRDLP